MEFSQFLYIRASSAWWTYKNEAEKPTTAPDRRVSIVCTDVNGLSSPPVNTTIQILEVNDAPIVDLDGPTISFKRPKSKFTEGTPLVLATPDATISDVDSVNLTKCTATLTGATTTGQEVLSVNNQGGLLSVSFDNVTNVLTFQSSATSAPLSLFQNALRTLTYNYNSENPQTTPDRSVVGGSFRNVTGTLTKIERVIKIQCLDPLNAGVCQ